MPETGRADAGINSENESQTELFLVLEGGGARGVAHVAAWRALENLVSTPTRQLPDEEHSRQARELGPGHYTLSAVAGTSAGAVAAAFIAAGAKADDIVGRDGRVPLCGVLNLEYFHDIFEARGWHRLRAMRRFQRPSKRLLKAADSLTPPGEISLRGAAAQRAGANGEVRDADTRHEKMDPLARIILIVAGTVVLLQIIDGLLELWKHSGADKVFEIPGIGAILFILFWGVAQIVAKIWTVGLQWAENRQRAEGRRGYTAVFRRMAHPMAPILVAAAIMVALSAVAIPYEDLRKPLSRPIFGNLLLQPVLSGFAAILAVTSIISILRRTLKGIVKTDLIQAYIDRALRTVLTKTAGQWDDTAQRHAWGPKPATVTADSESVSGSKAAWLTFGDLYSVTKIQLTVVAADIIKNEVRVYSTMSDWDRPVAQAIAASMAIPIAFRPVRDGQRLLVDGGLVSSIPAWVYRRHRTRDPDCRILAIGIEPQEFDTWIPNFFDMRGTIADNWRAKGRGAVGGQILSMVGKLIAIQKYPFLSLMWPLRFALNVSSTASNGARALQLDASDRLDRVALAPNLGLLDFDIERLDLAEELEYLTGVATVGITNRLWRSRKQFRAVCARIENVLRGRVKDGIAQEHGWVRMFWAERDGTAHAVRIKHTYNFDPDKHLDDRLVFPYQTSMTAWAMETKLSQFGTDEVLKKMLIGRMNRYRSFVRWRDLKWCWAIPVRDTEQNEVKGILAIESDLELDKFDAVVGQAAQSRADNWMNNEKTELRHPTELKTIAFTPFDATARMSILERDWAQWMAKDFVTLPEPEGRREGLLVGTEG